MNTEIKVRIEMINKGEVPEGYKKTKIGIIPEEWQVKRLIDVKDSQDRYAFTGGPFGSDLKTEHYTDDGVRILQLQNIGDGIFLDNYKIYTSNKKADELHSCNIYPEEILIAKMAEPLARACIVPSGQRRYLMASDGIRLKVDSNNYSTKYVMEYINSSHFRKEAIKRGTGTTRLRIGLGELSEIKLALPDKSEQQEIAQILSAWDKAIELKEKLIEEKKEQKKGLMQKLLTGEVRLPGFDEEWEEARLGEVIELQGGYAFESSSYKEDGVPIIRISNIEKIVNLNKDVVYYDPIEIDDKFLVKRGDLLIAMSGATTGKTGVYRNYNIAYLNQRVGKFIAIREELYYQYLYHIVENKEFQNQLNKRLVAGAQPNISSADVESLIFKMPSLKEQKAIAQILSTADKEIDLLIQELDLLKLQKKGLMQLLLTGVVRVKC
ncbi:type I restriction enzyme, S subunit [Proteiniborus ethanoligenes]|uniref:Type I restriction enzyme, S subunit n=1 Tax=Proteiniborus ethanoligenes TaxID=415015 RepID=A0A1H3MEB5_9FIRM|nr:restriction endonuclease subunit S [Proteiniborus ethanoligenes]SDY74345.1 type I restriction enzyme, S subunit [Proteiniborus ethanoligenes]